MLIEPRVTHKGPQRAGFIHSWSFPRFESAVGFIEGTSGKDENRLAWNAHSREALVRDTRLKSRRDTLPKRNHRLF